MKTVFRDPQPAGIRRVSNLLRTLALVLVSTVGIRSAVAQSQKLTDGWQVDVGLTLAKPVWTFSSFNSVGIGIDASATRPVSFLENLYVGGRVNYAHYLAKKESDIVFLTSEPANLIGILGDAHYVYDGKYVIGGNLGVGIRFPAFFGSTGFARAGYIGYQLPVNNRPFLLSVYLSRTTFATHVFGLRGSIRL